MIGNITYEDINKVITTINASTNELETILKKNNITELEDFLTTVIGYSKYLETTVKLYQDADNAISDLIKN